MKNMKKSILLSAGLFLMILTAKNLQAGEPQVSGEATATATIITPIAIEKNADLYFGNIIATAEGGTVAISAGSDDPTYNGVSAPSVTGTRQRAEFVVTGLSGAAFTITLPADGAVTLTGAGNEMELTGWVHNSGEVLESGTNTFQVGATLNVNADQAAGQYTADFEVTVNYN